MECNEFMMWDTKTSRVVVHVDFLKNEPSQSREFITVCFLVGSATIIASLIESKLINLIYMFHKS